MILLKAILLGALLTWVIASFVAGGGSTGGHLNIEHFVLSGHRIQWSWPLFAASTGLSWGVMWLMR